MKKLLKSLLPLLAVLAAAFCRAVALPVWKSASVFLGVCGVWSSLSCLAVIANAVLSPGSRNTPWFCFAAGWIQLALCCAEALYCLVDTLMPWFVETFRLQYVAYKSISVFFKHQCAQDGGFYFGVARHKTTCDVGQHGVGASVATSEIISSFII